MLTVEERQEIEAEFARYPTKRAVCIDAMKIVQQHRGWVSDEGLRDIAEFLEVSTTDLDGVATFYNLIHRKPVGRHVVYVCDSVSCWIAGCDSLQEKICSHLGVRPGETTADGRITVLPIVCLGACDRAPVLMVDGEMHLDLDQEKTESILAELK